MRQFGNTPRLHHVQIAIPVGGEKQARAFYAGLLGLEERSKPDALSGRGGCWFRTGTLDVHCGADPAFVPATKAHIALEVDDLDAVRARLDAAGCATNDDVPLPGLRRFHVIDPFGNRQEIVQAVDQQSDIAGQ